MDGLIFPGLYLFLVACVGWFPDDSRRPLVRYRKACARFSVYIVGVGMGAFGLAVLLGKIKALEGLAALLWLFSLSTLYLSPLALLMALVFLLFQPLSKPEVAAQETLDIGYGRGR